MRRFLFAATLQLGLAAASTHGWSQQLRPSFRPSQTSNAAKPGGKSPDQKQSTDDSKPKPAPELPAQIELLETRVRFETDGDSRKEVHARVKINDEIGIRQFGRLNFNYNRAFQAVEIPLAHITHAHGGTSDVLPSAISDNPDPAVINFPAYQDVRVKSIRILGLAPGDIFEYRVVTTTTHHPLAPDFWFEHTFDRSGVTLHETLDLDLPKSRSVQFRENPELSGTKAESGPGDSARELHHWDATASRWKPGENPEDRADIGLTTYPSWQALAAQINKRELENGFVTTIYTEADQRLGGVGAGSSLESLYERVSQKIATVDLPFDVSLSVRRGAAEILKSGYGTEEEKARLLSVLATLTSARCSFALYSRTARLEHELPRPTLFSGVLLAAIEGSKHYFLDPGLEVAPFGLVPSDLRGTNALKSMVPDSELSSPFVVIPAETPFPSKEVVTVSATVARDGGLVAQTRYSMRGDNELVLRLAFHQAPKEKWNEVAQLLAVSDGFRGKISRVTASDPFATQQPFTVQFEVEQAKLLDWTKTPLRIPAIIPLLGLPDPAAKTSASATAPTIALGTPLEVQVSATVHLPAGTGAEVPAGTAIQRDFATYESHYAVNNGTLSASRHINFILREIPADRAAEYNAFLHAVQNDESQLFTLDPPENLRTKPVAPEPKSATGPAKDAAQKP